MLYHRLTRLVIVSVVFFMFCGNGSTLEAFSCSSITNAFKVCSPARVVNDLFDRYCVRNFGGQEADAWCVDTAHEFLSYLGVSDAQQVNIRKLEIPLLPSGLNLDKLPAITLWTGLWFNPGLEQSTEGLWHIAHESAHFALHHPLKSLLMLKARPAMVAGTLSTLFLVGNVLLVNNTINAHSSILKKSLALLLKSAVVGTISAPIILKTYVTMIVAGLKGEKEFEEEADLTAARMLCEHGYGDVLKHHIDALTTYIEQGVTLPHPYAHPSLIETRDYLQEYWDQWLAEHVDYAQSPK